MGVANVACVRGTEITFLTSSFNSLVLTLRQNAYVQRARKPRLPHVFLGALSGHGIPHGAVRLECGQ